MFPRTEGWCEGRAKSPGTAPAVSVLLTPWPVLRNSSASNSRSMTSEPTRFPSMYLTQSWGSSRWAETSEPQSVCVQTLGLNGAHLRSQRKCLVLMLTSLMFRDICLQHSPKELPAPGLLHFRLQLGRHSSSATLILN